MIRDSKIQTESLVAGAESPLVSTYSFSKPLSSKFRVVVFLIHEGQGRTPLLIHEGPLRGTKNGNGNTFVRGGHGGPRRTATAELQLQLLFVHEGPRRTATATPLSAEVAEGRGERQLQNCNCSFFLSTKGHEERQRQHLCPRRSRRAAENGICGRRRSWS